MKPSKTKRSQKKTKVSSVESPASSAKKSKRRTKRTPATRNSPRATAAQSPDLAAQVAELQGQLAALRAAVEGRETRVEAPLESPAQISSFKFPVSGLPSSPASSPVESSGYSTGPSHSPLHHAVVAQSAGGPPPSTLDSGPSTPLDALSEQIAELRTQLAASQQLTATSSSQSPISGLRSPVSSSLATSNPQPATAAPPLVYELKETRPVGYQPQEIFDFSSEESQDGFFASLLDRARIQWLIGDWDGLAKIDLEQIQHHPDRGILAGIAAAAHAELANFSKAREFLSKASHWGAPPFLLKRLLSSNILKALGTIAEIKGDKKKAENYFRESLKEVLPGSFCEALKNEKSNFGSQTALSTPVFLKLQDIGSYVHKPALNWLNSNLQALLSVLMLQSSKDHVDEVIVEFDDKPILSLSFRHHVLDEFPGTLSGILAKHCVEDLSKRLHFKFSNKSKSIIHRPFYEEQKIVDHKLFDKICKNITQNKQRHLNYLEVNYERVFQDAKIICDIPINLKSHILDVGSVPPLLAALLAERGYSNITIADPNASVFSHYINSINAKYIDLDILTTLPDSSQSYDLILFCEVLEHLTGDIRSAIKALKNWLKPGGYLLVSTPNLRSAAGFYGFANYGGGLASKYTEGVRQQYDRLEKDGYFGHVREFTPKEVIDLFGSFGFQHIQTYYQPDYRRAQDPIGKLKTLIELAIPELRLFARYVFQKPN